MHDRRATRRLAARSIREGRPTGWFEELYRRVRAGTASAPWDDRRPAPGLLEFWRHRRPAAFHPARALVVGCGFGEDAEQLARWGLETTAFDIAPTAIEAARARHPRSRVAYRVADLLAPIHAWGPGFDLVLETYTLQVLPPVVRRTAIDRVAACVAPGGWLLVIARGRRPSEPAGSLPWPLTWRELGRFRRRGLVEMDRWEHHDPDTPSVRRFGVLYRRRLAPPRARGRKRIRPARREPNPSSPRPAPVSDRAIIGGAAGGGERPRQRRRARPRRSPR